MRRELFIGIAVVVVVAFLGLFYFGSGQPADSNSGGDPAKGAVHVFGEATAPVEIVEFANYLCSHCQDHALNVLSPLMAEYVETGRVRYVFRDFPFTGQANVIRAGEAAACADDQGAYVNYHTLLFRDMQGWGGLGLDVLDQRFTNYAQQLGLDPSVGRRAVRTEVRDRAAARHRSDRDHLVRVGRGDQVRHARVAVVVFVAGGVDYDNAERSGDIGGNGDSRSVAVKV